MKPFALTVSVRYRRHAKALCVLAWLSGVASCQPAYVSDRMDELEGRAPRDLHCHEDDVHVVHVAPAIIAAAGCGRMVQYPTIPISSQF